MIIECDPKVCPPSADNISPNDFTFPFPVCSRSQDGGEREHITLVAVVARRVERHLRDWLRNVPEVVRPEAKV